jgi:hypothetical protein
MLTTGVPPARDTIITGPVKNPVYSQDQTGNILSENKTGLSENFGNIDGFGEISRSIATNWNFSLEPDSLLKVEVSPSELNPYPNFVNPFLSSKITVTVTNDDGTPRSNEQVMVKACTKVSSGGHTHDMRTSDCNNGTRPNSLLLHQTQRGNPITITTDNQGKASIFYFPPKIFNKGVFYIAGQDIINATLVSNPSIKDQSKTIITKVPGLEEMPGSLSCRGGGTFSFSTQSNHGCLFYGTSQTNQAILEIANEYASRQIECRDNPGSNACRVTTDVNNQITIAITGNNPVPIIITAMGLPLGGLSDISGNWNPPHRSHNTGKQIDLAISNQPDDAHKLLLRQVIMDNSNFLNIVRCEGRENLITAKPSCISTQLPTGLANHIHANFRN